MGDPANTHSSESTALKRESTGMAPSVLQPTLSAARAWRERIRSNPATRIAWKAVTGLVGTAVLVGGLFLVPLPGPGWLVVILGLAILASEFEWAHHLLQFVKQKVRAWSHWVGQQPVPVRLGIGALTLAFVGCVLWGMFVVLGVPEWVPGQLIPPLPGL